MKLGAHMPGGERRKRIDIEDRRTKVKVTTSKNRTQFVYFFRFARYLKNEMSDLNETWYMLKGGSLSILRFVGQRSRSKF
jgi:hypothetical protein